MLSVGQVYNSQIKEMMFSFFSYQDVIDLLPQVLDYPTQLVDSYSNLIMWQCIEKWHLDALEFFMTRYNLILSYDMMNSLLNKGIENEANQVVSLWKKFKLPHNYIIIDYLSPLGYSSEYIEYFIIPYKTLPITLNSLEAFVRKGDIPLIKLILDRFPARAEIPWNYIWKVAIINKRVELCQWIHLEMKKSDLLLLPVINNYIDEDGRIYKPACPQHFKCTYSVSNNLSWDAYLKSSSEKITCQTPLQCALLYFNICPQLCWNILSKLPSDYQEETVAGKISLSSNSLTPLQIKILHKVKDNWKQHVHWRGRLIINIYLSRDPELMDFIASEYKFTSECVANFRVPDNPGTALLTLQTIHRHNKKWFREIWEKKRDQICEIKYIMIVEWIEKLYGEQVYTGMQLLKMNRFSEVEKEMDNLNWKNIHLRSVYKRHNVPQSLIIKLIDGEYCKFPTSSRLRYRLITFLLLHNKMEVLTYLFHHPSYWKVLMNDHPENVFKYMKEFYIFDLQPPKMDAIKWFYRTMIHNNKSIDPDDLYGMADMLLTGQETTRCVAIWLYQQNPNVLSPRLFNIDCRWNDFPNALGWIRRNTTLMYPRKIIETYLISDNNIAHMIDYLALYFPHIKIYSNSIIYLMRHKSNQTIMQGLYYIQYRNDLLQDYAKQYLGHADLRIRDIFAALDKKSCPT